MSLIHIDGLTKHFKILNRREGLGGAFRDLFSADYRTVEAVAGISFDIEPGEIVGYIGPNGAGKSTTIKMMTGILKPTGGVIQVNGQVPYDNRIRQAQIMGVVFGQRSQLWWDLPRFISSPRNSYGCVSSILSCSPKTVRLDRWIQLCVA